MNNFELQPEKQPISSIPEFLEPPAPETQELPLEMGQLEITNTLDLSVDLTDTIVTNTTGENQIKSVRGIGFLLAVSQAANSYLREMAEIDRDTITDAEMQPARVYAGLTFIGFGSLGLFFLILYLSSCYPQLSFVEQIKQYWYQYIGLVCLGVAGMCLVGRESLRGRVIDSNSED